ncbi:MAG: hypothetical protein HPY85_03900 [Anaerolineae bacterium]|nr:hypothetical protein [Anaerolineae bacterium]
MMRGFFDPITVQKHRQITYRLSEGERLTSPYQAVAYVNERGFILFHPAKNVVMPSLWVATAGDRPVPNEHDDPGQITWAWKDDLLDKRTWYYGRLLNQKMSIIALDMLPKFYALSPNYGDYLNDYLLQYKDGTLTFECKSIYETLLSEGPMNTLMLREKAGLWGEKNQYRYTRSLNQLMQEMKILPVGVAAAGRWNYAFIYDILPRYFPALESEAGKNSQKQARMEILERYLESVGCAELKDIGKIFRWSESLIIKTLDHLIQEGKIAKARWNNDASSQAYGLVKLLI